MRNAELQWEVELRRDAYPDIPHSEFGIPHSVLRIPHSVLIRHLYGHPILRNNRLLEDLTSLLDQLVGTDRVPRRDVTEHQAPSLRGEGHLRRLTRRRMPRLLGPLLLLLPKRRLMDEQVRPLRRIYHCRTRPRVP